MDGTETETEEPGWTKANLQKLLAAMKTSIPKRERMTAYPRGLKSVNWNEVAFPPFSPEACQEKWMQIFQKMRKIRTLTELIDEAEGVISDPDQNSKIHPELPKRPCPPNTIFYEENWAKFHEKHPNMARKKLFKRVLKKYQKLPDEEKAQYVEKFEIAQEEYNRRMLEFSKHYTNDPKCESKKYRKRKRVSADGPDSKRQTEAANDLPPRPPMNGYKIFCKEQCASMTGSSGDNYVRVWAQRWRDLTEEQRDEYTTRCKELQRQYSVELHDYLQKFDKEKQQQILNENGLKAPQLHKRKIVRERTKRLPGEPKRPSLCSNAVFVKTQMERLKDKFPNSRARFSKISQMWQDLSIKEKEHYKQEVHKIVRKYSMELQKWFKTLPAAEQRAYRKHNKSQLKYLDINPTEVNDREGARGALHRPSDSEDEDIEDSSSSSSDEEEEDLNSEVEEQEEDDDDVITFKLY